MMMMMMMMMMIMMMMMTTTTTTTTMMMMMMMMKNLSHVRDMISRSIVYFSLDFNDSRVDADLMDVGMLFQHRIDTMQYTHTNAHTHTLARTRSQNMHTPRHK